MNVLIGQKIDSGETVCRYFMNVAKAQHHIVADNIILYFDGTGIEGHPLSPAEYNPIKHEGSIVVEDAVIMSVDMED